MVEIAGKMIYISGHVSLHPIVLTSFSSPHLLFPAASAYGLGVFGVLVLVLCLSFVDLLFLILHVCFFFSLLSFFFVLRGKDRIGPKTR
ncbi:hypothetical protein BZA77DRAFT_301313 [Pyronema omphalodes]|nr:hypothetical protein BZA77DRAFT_301313 [Pyronema omphalodes]